MVHCGNSTTCFRYSRCMRINMADLVVQRKWSLFESFVIAGCIASVIDQLNHRDLSRAISSFYHSLSSCSSYSLLLVLLLVLFSYCSSYPLLHLFLLSFYNRPPFYYFSSSSFSSFSSFAFDTRKLTIVLIFRNIPTHVDLSVSNLPITNRKD